MTKSKKAPLNEIFKNPLDFEFHCTLSRNEIEKALDRVTRKRQKIRKSAEFSDSISKIPLGPSSGYWRFG